MREGERGWKSRWADLTRIVVIDSGVVRCVRRQHPALLYGDVGDDSMISRDVRIEADIDIERVFPVRRRGTQTGGGGSGVELSARGRKSRDCGRNATNFFFVRPRLAACLVQNHA